MPCNKKKLDVIMVAHTHVQVLVLVHVREVVLVVALEVVLDARAVVLVVVQHHPINQI